MPPSIRLSFAPSATFESGDEHAIENDGQPPTFTEADATKEVPATQTFANHFGSWNAAVAEAGFEPRDRHRTDEELLEDLRAVAETLGERPSITTVHSREEMASPSTYVNHLGSWSAAIEAAGLPVFDANARL